MLFTVTNEINFALVAIDIAPSTLIALSTLTATYFYITRDKQLPIAAAPTTTSINSLAQHGHDPRARRPLRRPSLLRRLTSRLRTRKQRARAIAPLPAPNQWSLSLAPLWLQVRGIGLGQRGEPFWRRIQPAGVAPRKERHA
jgi:hypothetical protein